LVVSFSGSDRQLLFLEEGSQKKQEPQYGERDTEWSTDHGECDEQADHHEGDPEDRQNETASAVKDVLHPGWENRYVELSNAVGQPAQLS